MIISYRYTPRRTFNRVHFLRARLSVKFLHAHNKIRVQGSLRVRFRIYTYIYTRVSTYYYYIDNVCIIILRCFFFPKRNDNQEKFVKKKRDYIIYDEYNKSFYILY